MVGERTEIKSLTKEELNKIEKELKEKKELKEEFLGFKKGYKVTFKDPTAKDILLLKPKDAKKHEYFIPEYSLHIAPLQHICDAIQTFLKQEGKDRTKITITDEKAGVYDFFVADHIHAIGREISKIRVSNLVV